VDLGDHARSHAFHQVVLGERARGRGLASARASGGGGGVDRGDGDAADNIIGGPEHSTLANDAFRSREFDFMLANPPYGKSWKSDLERMSGEVGRMSEKYQLAEGWRRHSHLGFCPEDFDPIADLLKT
jgi:hypothetical protein